MRESLSHHFFLLPAVDFLLLDEAEVVQCPELEYGVPYINADKVSHPTKSSCSQSVRPYNAHGFQIGVYLLLLELENQ